MSGLWHPRKVALDKIRLKQHFKRALHTHTQNSQLNVYKLAGGHILSFSYADMTDSLSSQYHYTILQFQNIKQIGRI